MGAFGDDAPAVEEDDPVGEGDGRGSVGDDQRGPSGHDLAQRGADLVLLGRVDRRGCIVENQDARVGEHRPCDREPLALSTRE